MGWMGTQIFHFQGESTEQLECAPVSSNPRSWEIWIILHASRLTARSPKPKPPLSTLMGLATVHPAPFSEEAKTGGDRSSIFAEEESELRSEALLGWKGK